MYPKLAENQGWTKSSEEGWLGNECGYDKYASLHDVHNSGNSPTNDVLIKILDKVKGSDVILNEMKNDFLTLSNTVISHSFSIKSLEEKMSKLAALIFSDPNEELVPFSNENSMKAIQLSAIITRSGKTLQERKRHDDVVAQRVAADDKLPMDQMDAQTKEVEDDPKPSVKDSDIAAPTIPPKISNKSTFSSMFEEEI
ncbi:hypothetical protein MTR67_002941 [Solanum verrucosum]|uniref:Uncharacterized protein n=1 Tax=Solanum verrucosum TaxID=315347 RepID=A0AAF0PRS8_SOLVR|nr:hypothetical protein MTR67_002941 [Solanum verrucosum]